MSGKLDRYNRSSLYEANTRLAHHNPSKKKEDPCISPKKIKDHIAFTERPQPVRRKIKDLTKFFEENDRIAKNSIASKPQSELKAKSQPCINFQQTKKPISSIGHTAKKKPHDRSLALGIPQANTLPSHTPRKSIKNLTKFFEENDRTVKSSIASKLQSGLKAK